MRIHFWQSNWFRVTFGTAVSGLFLYLAVRDVSLGEVAQSLTGANYGWVALSSAIVVLGSFLRAVRWRRLYFPLDAGLRLRQLWGISLVGQMVNIVLPWRMGEVARIILAGEIEQRSKLHTLATLGVEKIFDLLMLLAILVSIPLFMTLPNWLEEPRAGLALSAGVLLGGAAVLLFARDWLLGIVGKISFLRARSIDRRAQLALSSLDVLKQGHVHLELQVLSILIWSQGALTNYLVLLSLDLPLAFISGYVILVVLQIGGLVPSSPGKIGVFQYLCILALSLFGVDKSIGLSYGILLYLSAYGPPIILGTLFLWWEGINLRRLSPEATS